RTNKMNPQNFWKKYEFALNQTLLFKAGFVEVFVKHISNGWLIKSRVPDQPNEGLQVEEVAGFDDESEVFHFQTGKSHDLMVVPALPNKAVVFRNNKVIKISAGELANLYFRIPLDIQFYFQEVKEENLLIELPLQRLSDTWFGEADNGEPAFSIGSNYDKEFSEIKAMPWEAVAPVEINNNTAGVFDLQRLILRVEDFSLFLKNKQLLTNHVAIEFRGPEHAGSVNLSVKKEIHAQKPLQLAKPRNEVGRNLLRKSFFFIKNIYQS
ncbi:MAG: hypothetical protein Q7U65_01665, partial [Bacteroidota bacterium]|nr:hypothetical protein [Bacteroidota bacterium]